MPHELFAERLGAAMAASGLNQAGLIRAAASRGRKLGKSQVSQYVSGKTVPRRDVMRLLADLLAAVRDIRLVIAKHHIHWRELCRGFDNNPRWVVLVKYRVRLPGFQELRILDDVSG